MIHREMLIDGHFVGGVCDLAVGKDVMRSPFDGHVIGTAAEGSWNEMNSAIAAATDAYTTWRLSSLGERQQLLRRIAASVRKRADELAALLVEEIGKPIVAAEGEVTRLAITFDLAADALEDWAPEISHPTYDPRGVGHEIRVERCARGPLLAIVPYNWPYNLSAHKIAPALATGNTVILKPSPLAPISTLTLARLIHEVGCPSGVLNAVNVDARTTEQGVLDERVKMVSFTGSPAVGWHIKSLISTKPVTLELGGDAFAVVMEDADLDWTTQRLVAGAFGYAGQICISIQNAVIHASLYEDLRERLIAATVACPVGAPGHRATVCGPLISAEAAVRVADMVQEAVDNGAIILVGDAIPDGAILKPILLENVPPNCRLAKEEVFGPVLSIRSFATVEEAVGIVNSSDFGIQAGVFTSDRDIAERLYRELEVVGLIFGDYPTLRFDSMAYGGAKCSGFGREGVRYAMESMCELRTFVDAGRNLPQRKG